MATRISVRKNPNGQHAGWACKHSVKAAQPAECDGHVVLCERCHASVKNGAELLDYETRQPIVAAKVTPAGQATRAAAAK
jgi:hypothetical protein